MHTADLLLLLHTSYYAPHPKYPQTCWGYSIPSIFFGHSAIPRHRNSVLYPCSYPLLLQWHVLIALPRTMASLPISRKLYPPYGTLPLDPLLHECSKTVHPPDLLLLLAKPTIVIFRVYFCFPSIPTRKSNAIIILVTKIYLTATMTTYHVIHQPSYRSHTLH